ncbi:hypothetical protein GOBAR_AA06128 [Gossypium barbadense]|uniref:Uncharacterized protein n=1 Tax=Gossypium barbadense TaxID=3634 RepID=A0A2P5YFV8_GOSBA|nr:hypothetical protein GOBAR_AA06128 [Gossypium barbadense]
MASLYQALLLYLARIYGKGLLTKKFINLIEQAEDGIQDLNKAAGTLRVNVRGLDVSRPGEVDENVATLQWELHNGNIPCRQRLKTFIIRNEIRWTNKNEMLIAIKAPHGTTLEVPDPDEKFEEIQGVGLPSNLPSTSGLDENPAASMVTEESREVETQGRYINGMCLDCHVSQDFVSGIMKIVPSDLDNDADYWLLSDPSVSITDIWRTESGIELNNFDILQYTGMAAGSTTQPQTPPLNAAEVPPPDSSLMKQPECNKGEGEGEDKELEEDDISQDSDCFSSLSNSKPWHFVRLEKTCQRNEQVALLLKVLKCDKSVIPSIYEFRILLSFHAYLTLDEAENLSELEEVEEIGLPSMSVLARKAKRIRSLTSDGLLKAKKQKTSMRSILCWQAAFSRSGDKTKRNGDFEPEPESDIKDLEEEDLSDDLLDDYGSSCRYEGYDGFDASGKRIRNEKLSSHSIELGCPGSDMSLGKINMKLKIMGVLIQYSQIKRELGLEEVEYVEPRRYIMELN